MNLQASLFQSNDTAGFTDRQNQSTGVAVTDPFLRQLYSTAADKNFPQAVAPDIILVSSKRLEFVDD